MDETFKEPEETLKPKDVFQDTSPAYRRKRRRGYFSMSMACCRYLAGWPRAPRELEATHPERAPFVGHEIAPEFFGMNICPSPDPAGDDIQLQALDDLGPGAIRIDYGQHIDRAPADRLIEKLLAAGHPLTLHLVQDISAASVMRDDKTARAEWSAFLAHALERWGPRLEAIEAGSTPNRHSWSGYTLDDYAATAALARRAIDEWAAAAPGREPPLLLGPNISDFAPYFTVGQLARCRRHGARFDVMTDNLFIDRVGEPEAYDPHVAGVFLKNIARLDMTAKQRILARIARRFGLGRSWCTYTHYTLNFGKERRRYVSPEQYANYMVRSHVLTAGAGAFERFYWGTLVTNFKGLIDETLGVRPYPPFVHHRFAIDGAPSEWRRRERFFHTYSTMTKFLKGCTFVKRWPCESARAYVLEFRGPKGHICVGWTRDGGRHLTSLARPGTGDNPSSLFDRDGRQKTVHHRIELTESPQYWLY